MVLCQWPIATILTDLCKMTFRTDLLGVNNWKHDIAQCEAKFSGEDVVPMPFQQSLPYAHPGVYQHEKGMFIKYFFHVSSLKFFLKVVVFLCGE